MATKTVSAKELSEFLDLTERHVQRLAKEEVLPKANRGKYPFKESVAAYVQSLRERINSNSGSLTDHRTRAEKARADILEIEAAEKRGELAPIEDFEKATEAVMRTIRNNMMNIPQRAITRLLGETDETRFKDVLRDEIVQALTVTAQAEIEEDE